MNTSEYMRIKILMSGLLIPQLPIILFCMLPERVYVKATLVHCTHRNFYHGLKIEMEKDLVDMWDGFPLFYYLCYIDKYNQRKSK